jgi:hypothetical protein
LIRRHWRESLRMIYYMAKIEAHRVPGSAS